MVTVIDFKTKKTEEGKNFNTLILQGEIEMVQSKTTGRFYATAKTCSISCTFNDVICAGLIGKTIPGEIEKMECDPYDYKVPGSDEIIKLTHTYFYNPSPRGLENEVFDEKIAA